MNDWFARVASEIATQAGAAWFFGLSLLVILLWLIAGPFYGWSDGWVLLMHTVTAVLTWLLGLLILQTQNRDTKAIQLKLAELVRATEGARNALASAEDLDERELDRIKRAQISSRE